MKKDIKKNWESPKLISLDNSSTEVGALPGIEGFRTPGIHMGISTFMPGMTEMS